MSSTAIPECTKSEKVAVAVKAFQAANFAPDELLKLLKKILLEKSAFNDNKSLETLLLYTAIEVRMKRVDGDLICFFLLVVSQTLWVYPAMFPNLGILILKT